MAKFKVIRAGISQRDGDQWKSPPIGALIELSETAATHLLSVDPPFVAKLDASEKSKVAEAKPAVPAEAKVEPSKPRVVTPTAPVVLVQKETEKEVKKDG